MPDPDAGEAGRADMVLSLHGRRITLLRDAGLERDTLVSLDAGGTVAVWEARTCHCSRTAHLPVLAALGVLQACFLPASGAALAARTFVRAMKPARATGTRPNLVERRLLARPGRASEPAKT